MSHCVENRVEFLRTTTEVVEGKVLLENVSSVNKRCHKNVVQRLDFRAAGPQVSLRYAFPDELI
jgi:hypothetical protein